MWPSVKEHRTWLRTQEKNPDNRKAAYAALNAYEAIAQRGSACPPDLTPIVEAVANRSQSVWDCGVNCLMDLAQNHQAARDAVRLLLDSSSAATRFHIVYGLQGGLPKPLTLEVLRRGLRDRSSQVRTWAASMCGRFRWHETLPDMRACLAAEKNAKVKETILYELPLVEFGYFVRSDPDRPENVTLVVAHRMGISSVTISARVANNPRALAKAVRRILKENDVLAERFYSDR